MRRFEKLLKRWNALETEEAINEFIYLITRDLHHEFYWILEGGCSSYSTSEAYKDLVDYLLEESNGDYEEE